MPTSKRKTVFVGMSGGVDSSVAALMLKKQGYNVVGVFMRCFNLDGCAEKDAEDARRVAEMLKIPFYSFEMEEEYKNRVVDYMIRGYAAGLTPNPDVMCNREIKFGLFFDKAKSMGADYVATGHYALRKETSPGKFAIFQAADKSKDQSYFLWTLTQKELQGVLFPLGSYLKSRVRQIAKEAELPNASKKDSQGICFLGQVGLKDFLSEYLPEKRGLVLSAAGEKVGEHVGAHFYTIGQRHGVGELKHAKGNKIHEPLYVASKDVEANTLTVVPGRENPELHKKEINIAQVNLIKGMSIKNIKDAEMSVLARVRYRQPLIGARLEYSSLTNCVLSFEKPQKFVAPGQSAVWYGKNGQMLGGGIIL